MRHFVIPHSFFVAIYCRSTCTFALFDLTTTTKTNSNLKSVSSQFASRFIHLLKRKLYVHCRIVLRGRDLKSSVACEGLFQFQLNYHRMKWLGEFMLHRKCKPKFNYDCTQVKIGQVNTFVRLFVYYHMHFNTISFCSTSLLLFFSDAMLKLKRET